MSYPGWTPEQIALTEREGTGRLGTAPNQHGTPTTVLRCHACGECVTVCPTISAEFAAKGCMGDWCTTYDVTSDLDIFIEPMLEAGMITLEPGTP